MDKRKSLVKKKLLVEKKTTNVDKEQQKNASIEDFTNMMREKCVLTDRWIVLDPQPDPSKGLLVSLIMELDITVEGELRPKRCIKVSKSRVVFIYNYYTFGVFRLGFSKSHLPSSR